MATQLLTQELSRQPTKAKPIMEQQMGKPQETPTPARSQEARGWFNHHRNLKEQMFNVIQELTSDIAGFVAVA